MGLASLRSRSSRPVVAKTDPTEVLLLAWAPLAAAVRRPAAAALRAEWQRRTITQPVTSDITTATAIPTQHG